MTLREQLAKHSRSPECSSCHVSMDAMGFALENYDAIGKWRLEEEEGQLTRLEIGDRNQFFRTHGITEIHCGEKTKRLYEMPH